MQGNRPAAGRLPEGLQKTHPRGRQPMDGRPGASLPPVDFDAATKKLATS